MMIWILKQGQNERAGKQDKMIIIYIQNKTIRTRGRIHHDVAKVDN